uniref:Uncharacterized protein n=1 Tax=Fagus sylvatica TaxID=28930 RepID=A0A2N9HN83_FAGSY
MASVIDSVVVNGTSIGGERERVGTSIDQGNGQLRSKVEEKKKVEDDVLETFKPLWDDGYGTETVRDYFDMAKDIVKHDGGPPRWFCPVTCGRPSEGFSGSTLFAWDGWYWFGTCFAP